MDADQPETPFEYLDTAIRVFPRRDLIEEPDTKKDHATTASKGRAVPRHVLVIDCETTTDPTQRLLFGVWRTYSDDPDTTPGSFCTQEGIFYADELPTTDPAAYKMLRELVETQPASVAPGRSTRLKLLPRTGFVNTVFFNWAYRLQATVVGFNLPFDLSRLALHASDARGRNRGGISLRLWSHDGGEHPYRPRIVIKTIDARRALINFTYVHDDTSHYRGRFLDLATLAFAHSDQRFSLEGACERFGVPYTKRDVVHGEITADYVTYCREDVAATAALYQAIQTEHLQHPIELPSHLAYSAATIGKAYWKALGITPFKDRIHPPDPTVAGYAMAAFYGGRSECRIRRIDVPVVYVDYLSMYMTINALIGTWQHIIAVQTTTKNITHQVRKLLADASLRDRCFDRELWSTLHTLVLIEPNDAILPVRARYDPHSFGIGANPLRSERPCWYPLGDVIAAVLLGGAVPVVKKALRMVPSDDHLAGMGNVRLRNQVEVRSLGDFFTTVVEHRHRTRHDTNLAGYDKQRLEGFLKVLGNATGYGILAQFDRTHTPKPIPMTIHTDHKPFTISTDSPEDLGAFTNPALAACDTGGARLMLALLEHEVTRHGGSYAFCDTDSMAIIATPTAAELDIEGDTVHALDWDTVQQIVDSFAALNPYDPDVIDGSILKIESENYDTDANQRELRCYSISAKRYQLTTTNGDNVKSSAHGLGHLINPTTGTDNTDWISDAWQWMRHPETEPDWLDLPALSRMTITSADAMHWFDTINDGLDYPQRIKPHNFLLIAHPDPLDHSTAQPVTAHHDNPTNWNQWQWIDRTTGHAATIHTRPCDGYQRPGTRVLTYRDILTRYHQHPETKSLDRHGQPCRGDTHGLLRRRPVHAIEPITYIGKEAHDLDASTIGLNGTNNTQTYPTLRNPEWTEQVVATLETIPTRNITNDTGVHPRTVQRAKNERRTPHERDRAVLHDYAVTHAREATGARRIRTASSVLYEYVTKRNTVTQHARDTE